MSTILKALVLATFLLPFTLVTSVSAKPIPLRSGVYHSVGSRYILIAKKNNRYCFNWISNRGLAYSSLLAVPNHPERYKMNAKKDSQFYGYFVVQTSKDTIDFGSLEEISHNNITNQDIYRFDGNYDENAIGKDSNLQRCLSSQKPFSLSIPLPNR